MSAALITVETEARTYDLSIRVNEAGNDPLPMLIYAAFRQLCDDVPELMQAETITIKAGLTP